MTKLFRILILGLLLWSVPASAQRTAPPVYLLMGEESYFIDAIAERLATTVLGEAERAFNQITVYGKDSEAGHIDMITSIYAHILDEDRKVNAQKFETAFYAKPDLRNVRPPEEPAKSEPATLDLESLVEQLQKSPELASALAALIAAQAPAK